MVVRGGRIEDVDKLNDFLSDAEVGTEGIEEFIEYFLILEDQEGRIQATLGIEPFGDHGLLRSLVMSPRLKEHDLLIMIEQIFRLAKERNLSSVYLATNKTKSLDFFSIMGFQKEEREQLPRELLQSKHVEHILSVDNSVFMRLLL